MALLSVIIPINSYDKRHWRCHTLISNALERNCEVILVIDARNVESQEAIKGHFSDIKSENFEMVLGNFGSPGEARNIGLKRATGDWVAFWDSDDFAYIDNVLSDICTLGEKYNVLVGRYRVFDLSKETYSSEDLRPKIDKRRRVEALVRNLGLWRMTFKVSRIKEFEFPDISMAEDKVFFSSLGLAESEIVFSKNHYYDYTVGSSQVLTRSRSAINDLRRAIQVLESATHTNIPNRKFKVLLTRKLAFTALKRGNATLKLFGIRTLAKSIWEFFRYGK